MYKVRPYQEEIKIQNLPTNMYKVKPYCSENVTSSAAPAASNINQVSSLINFDYFIRWSI